MTTSIPAHAMRRSQDVGFSLSTGLQSSAPPSDGDLRLFRKERAVRQSPCGVPTVSFLVAVVRVASTCTRSGWPVRRPADCAFRRAEDSMRVGFGGTVVVAPTVVELDVEVVAHRSLLTRSAVWVAPPKASRVLG